MMDLLQNTPKSGMKIWSMVGMRRSKSSVSWFILTISQTWCTMTSLLLNWRKTPCKLTLFIYELLTKKEIFTRKQPACIWKTDSIEGDYVTAIGHSQYRFLDNQANLTICPENICKQYYSSASQLPNGLTEKQICAVNLEDEKDTCSMNPGGPIMKTVQKEDSRGHFVVGILSFGGVCGTKDPRVYTKASSYLDWIESNVFKSKT